jgi:protein gp37
MSLFCLFSGTTGTAGSTVWLVQAQETKMLDQIRAGDTIVVWKLDRLARYTRDLLETMEAIRESGGKFQSLSEPWADTIINERYETRKAPAHMWFGVSVENRQACSRVAHLQKANAGVRFLSIEPLIAPVGQLDLRGIDWVIVGGESGPGARPMNPEWAIDIRNQCVAARVAFFFKQWGGRSPKAGGRLLEGREWNEFPAKRRAVQPELELRT